jgi:hypothetical protein
MADQLPAPPQEQSVNVFNPVGELVSIPASQLSDAASEGYTQASPQDVDRYAKEEKFSGAAQGLKAFAEGAASGATFGLSTGAETALGIATPSDIRGRQEIRSGLHATGEMAGLVASSLTPMGEGAILAKVGEMGAAKLIPKAATAFEKIGSAAFKGVIENAMVAAGDEVSRAFAQDPDQTVDSALAHIGLGAAIGGVAGGAFGAVSPLWDATVGPKASAFLSAIRDRAEGKTMPLTEDFQLVLNDLEKSGVKVAPEIKARFSKDQSFVDEFQKLRESGLSTGDSLRGAVETFKDDVGKQLKNAVHAGEDISAHEAGLVTKSEFIKVAQALDEKVEAAYAPLRDSEKNIMIADEARIKAQRALVEMGSNFGAKGSPEVATFERYGQRILQQNSLQDVKKLITELNNEWSTFGASKNTKAALNEIRGFLRDFEDKQVEGAFKKIAKESVDLRKRAKTFGEPLADTEGLAKAMIAERKAARDEFGKFMDTLSEVSGAGKLGKLRSLGDLEEALSEANSPAAKLASKLFDKKNIESLRMLKAKYPTAFDALAAQQRSHIIESATKSGTLHHSTVLNQVNALPKEVKNLIFSKSELDLINASGKTLKEINIRKNPSGSAGTYDALTKHGAAGIGAIIGAMSGHGFGTGFVFGEASKFLTRTAPETVKLSLMKFLFSSGPVDSAAWKAAADFIHASQKGHNLIESSVKSVFRSGREVLPQAAYPKESDLKKLDKKVTEYTQDPMKMMDVGGKTSHYLPDQATGLARSASVAVQYLNSIKPKQPQGSIFDMKIEPSKADQAAYDRQLGIAQQPLMVLDHIKKGELQPKDVQSIKTIYPSLYNKLKQKLSDNIIESQSNEEPLPYKTRLSMAMFMGEPLDGTMKPEAIVSAQGSGALSSSQSQQMQQGPGKGSMAKLGESNSLYQTPGQSREQQKQGKA